ncbi:MAG: hypothetical protein J6A79_05585 [Clostridia bacterium]|nr:hypothetical protein [Clostridia bacterium]
MDRARDAPPGYRGTARRRRRLIGGFVSEAYSDFIAVPGNLEKLEKKAEEIRERRERNAAVWLAAEGKTH